MKSDVVKIHGVEYRIKFIKEGGNKHESPTYHLVLIPSSKGNNILVVKDFACYTQGYSQGTNPSPMEWFLQIIGYGGAGNGRGQSTPGTPYLDHRRLEFITKVSNGDHYSDFQFNYIKFEYGTKLSDIKSQLI